MVIYVDSLFFVNFAMNFITLLITSKFIKLNKDNKIIFKRIVAASFFSALIYTSFVVFKIFRNFLNIYIVIFFIFLNIYITFRPNKIKELFNYALINHIAMFTLGGSILGLYYYTSFGGFLGNSIIPTVNNLSFKIFISLTCLSYFSIKSFIKLSSVLQKTLNKSIGIYIENNQNQMMNLLYDTGNDFFDPITKLPVVVMYYKVLENIIPNEIYALYKNKEDIIDAFLLEDEVVKKLKILPFKSLGCESGIILGVESEVAFVYDDVSYRKKCVLGIVDFEISKNGYYVGIFNTALISDNYP